MSRGKIVVWGLLAAYPFGGMTWQVLHYLEGLRRLDFDVWYVEDSDARILDPVTQSPTDIVEPNLAYLVRQLTRLNMQERWVFRPPGQYRQTYGALDMQGLTRLYADADAVLNLCGAHKLRDAHLSAARLVLVETDPVRYQVAVAKGDQGISAELAHYTHLLTYGTNLGEPDCHVPMGGFDWIPTRPPVIPDWWTSDNHGNSAVTTIANWNTTGKDIEWRGETWRWNKRDAFLDFVDAPACFSRPLELAVNHVGSDGSRLKNAGWRLTSATSLNDPDMYRAYIVGSHAEFSVAKEQYVTPRSGWFSDRSVCYLAAGRPVLVQETGFSKHLPTGSGLLAFTNMEDVAVHAASLEERYDVHRDDARRIAHEYFSAETVINDMMIAIGLQ